MAAPPLRALPLGSEDVADVAAEAMRRAIEGGSLGKCPGETFLHANYEAPGRVVAVGDVHGDLAQTLKVLKIAGLIEEQVGGEVTWVGGNATLIQLGDLTDRGDFEVSNMCFFHNLRAQAQAEGGNVFVLVGNHEALNVNGDFRYVTRGGFVETVGFHDLLSPSEEKEEKEANIADTLGQLVRGVAVGSRGPPLDPTHALRARLNMFAPGGLLAREMATYHTAMVINNVAFAHGGLHPHHATFGLSALNAATARWMRGEKTGDGVAGPPRLAVGGQDSVVWTRLYSKERFGTNSEEAIALAQLEDTLECLGLGDTGRMVVGHTPQMQGVNNENLKGKLWKVDVGLSSGVLHALPSCLEFGQDGTAQVLTNWNPASASASSSTASAPKTEATSATDA